MSHAALVLTMLQRDNALKEMRSKVHLLETTLAKHLSEKVRPHPDILALWPYIIKGEASSRAGG